jgi:hypothetical protein
VLTSGEPDSGIRSDLLQFDAAIGAFLAELLEGVRQVFMTRHFGLDEQRDNCGSDSGWAAASSAASVCV